MVPSATKEQLWRSTDKTVSHTWCYTTQQCMHLNASSQPHVMCNFLYFKSHIESDSLRESSLQTTGPVCILPLHQDCNWRRVVEDQRQARHPGTWVIHSQQKHGRAKQLSKWQNINTASKFVQATKGHCQHFAPFLSAAIKLKIKAADHEALETCQEYCISAAIPFCFFNESNNAFLQCKFIQHHKNKVLGCKPEFRSQTSTLGALN